MGIIVQDLSSAEQMNAILHNYGQYIIGRMGIPYRQKNISILSVAVDAPQDIISAISGKIGRLPGVSVKTAYAPA
jgi:putative iron-only hydrogenase system regulator